MTTDQHVKLYGQSIAKFCKQFWAQPRNRKILIISLIFLSIMAFYAGFLAHMFTHFKGGDYDQQTQYYEAARISILHYHQFPNWNPWESGGMPLYNNPQYGLISIQSITTLLFGTIGGLKIAYLIYVLIGFAGMYVLTRRVFGASPLRAILLSYIWIFCGFFSFHSIDHLGFSLMHFLPWLFYLFVRRHEGRNWIWFGLLVSLMLLTSPHYAVLMCFLVLVLLWVWQVVSVRPDKKSLLLGLRIPRQDVIFFAKSGAIIFILCAYRLIGAYQFIKDAPRVPGDLYEPANSPFLMLYALFGPINETGIPKNLHWGWGEYSGYMGLGIDAVCALLVVTAALYLWPRLRHKSAHKGLLTVIVENKLIVFLGLLGLTGFVLALGSFSRFSPMNILHQLPGYNQTRVASRWILITVFALLLYLGHWKKYAKVVNVLLALSVIELFSIFHYSPAFFSAYTNADRSYGASFQQVINPRYDRLMGTGVGYTDKGVTSLYINTIRNQGSIFTDDPLLNTTVSSPTVRCSNVAHSPCPFVISGNAKVSFWSPNKITLTRTSSGPVEIDMNPGSYWLVNGQRIPGILTPADSNAHFIINNPSKTLKLEVVPRYSIENLWRILTK